MNVSTTRPVRILFYAINGVGLGHLTRLLVIARAARRLTQALGVPAEYQFLTTSDGAQIARDFPVFKAPSKCAVLASGGDLRAYRASAKLLLSTITAGFQPDILVIDTMAAGAFQEFSFLRDYAQKTVFIDRHRNPDRALHAGHLANLVLYDLILVPDEIRAQADYPLPPRLRKQRRFIGRVHGFDPSSAWSRDEVRRYFGVRPNQSLLYISAGGGGDPHATKELEQLLDALASNPQWFLLVGYGPLYTGERLYRPNVVPLSETCVNRYFPAVDLAVSAAGYNTFEELLAAGTPTLFYAQEKGFDCQARRLAEGETEGWNGQLDSFDPSRVYSQVAEWLEEGHAREIAQTLRRRPPMRGGQRAALEILLLHSRLDGSPLADNPLRLCAALEQAYFSLPALAREARFPDVYQLCASWMEAKWSLAGQKTFAAQAADPSPSWNTRASSLLRWAVQITEWRRAFDWTQTQTESFLACGDGSLDPDEEKAWQRTAEDFFGELLARYLPPQVNAGFQTLCSRVPRKSVPEAMASVVEKLQEDPDAELPRLLPADLRPEPLNLPPPTLMQTD